MRIGQEIELTKISIYYLRLSGIKLYYIRKDTSNSILVAFKSHKVGWLLDEYSVGPLPKTAIKLLKRKKLNKGLYISLIDIKKPANDQKLNNHSPKKRKANA